MDNANDLDDFVECPCCGTLVKESTIKSEADVEYEFRLLKEQKQEDYEHYSMCSSSSSAKRI